MAVQRRYYVKHTLTPEASRPRIPAREEYDDVKLNEGTLYQINKRVNDGPWMLYDTVTTTREDAQNVMDAGLAFHLDRCPKDRVEFSITKVY